MSPHEYFTILSVVQIYIIFEMMHNHHEVRRVYFYFVVAERVIFLYYFYNKIILEYHIHQISIIFKQNNFNQTDLMEILSSFNLIIAAAIIVILSFWFNGISKKTNIPSVLMLIVLGVILQYILKYFIPDIPDFSGSLEILGTVGLIMIVLEAALELELKREKLVPILKATAIALIGLVASAWVAALIIYQFIPEMTMQSAWLYATPLSILSSAIIIPSVGGSQRPKKSSIFMKVLFLTLWVL